MYFKDQNDLCFGFFKDALRMIQDTSQLLQQCLKKVNKKNQKCLEVNQGWFNDGSKV